MANTEDGATEAPVKRRDAQQTVDISLEELLNNRTVRELSAAFADKLKQDSHEGRRNNLRLYKLQRRKLAAEHIHAKRLYRYEMTRRWYVAGLIVAALAFVIVMVLLFKDRPDEAMRVMRELLAMIGLFAGGYGVAKTADRRRRS